MAEFSEVIKQAKRMCKVMGDDCIGCPLRAVGECVFTEMYGENPEDWAEATVVEIERIVMQWSAEHPEPRYPSWHEAWKQLFPDAAEERPPCPRYFMDDERAMEYCTSRCEDCKHKPIPADIAEKLGIKPIGGDEE